MWFPGRSGGQVAIARRPSETRTLTRANVPAVLLGAGDGASSDPARLSPRAALRVGAVWSCVRLLAGTASTLPLKAYRPGAERVDESGGLLPGLLARPWPSGTTSDLVGEIVTGLCVAGNAFIGVFRDTEGRAVQLGLLPAEQVEVRREHGEPVYLYMTGEGVARLTARDVLHVSSPVRLPGSLVGLSPVGQLAAAFGEAEAIGRSAASFASQAVRPGVLIALPGAEQWSPEKRAEVTEAVGERFSRGGSGRPLVIGAEAKVEPMQLDLSSLEFVKNREFSGAEVCRAYGVPPELLGYPGGGNLNYTTAETKAADLLRFGLEPLLVAVERALTAHALARGVDVEFDRRGLLRPTHTDRATVYREALAGGWMTVDEVRAAESLPPLDGRERAGEAIGG
jgi:HK97 family phage portal protein